MQNKNTLIKGLIGLIILGLGLSALFLWMRGSNPPENERVPVSQPVATISATSTRSQSVQTIPQPLNEQDQLRVTQVIEKLKQTPITAAEVEQELKRKAAITPWPYGIKPSYSVNSVEDLPQVVYDFTLDDDGVYMPSTCIRAKNPGTPIFLQSIDQSPDYYMIPFFKDGQLCAVAVAKWKDGLGRFYTMMAADHFPFANISEAITLVEQLTHQKVIGTPRLVQGDFEESFTPLRAFWQMTTADGQIYYVFYGAGMYEDGEYHVFTSVIQHLHSLSSVILGKDLHPSGPRPTPVPVTPTPPPQKMLWPISPALADYSYPIDSFRDIAQVVYHYPFLESSGATGACILARNPGTPIYIGDTYYMIPFFQDEQLCALAIAHEKDQTGYLDAADRVDPAPFGDSVQVITLFEKAFGKKVQGIPILVNAPSPFQPFWKVTAADGQLYYVIFQSILNEDGRFSKTISITRAKN